VHPPFSVYHKIITAVAARQEQILSGERGLESLAAIRALEAVPDGFSYCVDIEAQSSGLLVLGARRCETNGAWAHVGDWLQSKQLFELAADLHEATLKKRQRLRR
jgi:hypothetical protein